MTRGLKDVLTVAGALVLILPELGCGSTSAKSASNAGGTSNTGGASNTGGITNGGTTSDGGSSSNAGGTSDSGVTSDAEPVCNITVLSNAAPACDVESASDAGPPLDAGSATEPTKPGLYAVGHASYMLSDTTVYSRPVFVSVWYPVDSGTITSTTPAAQYPLDPWSNKLPVSTSPDWEALGYDPAYEGPTASGNGPFPLVMVSPGWMTPDWSYLFIGTRLASHGFVVAIADHNDPTYSWSPPGDIVVAMFNRTRDVSFAITELLLKNGAAGELLAGTIDPSRIAMSGHSLGGYATYALAGGDDEVCDAWYLSGGDNAYPQYTCAPTVPDPRIRAIVSLDGSSWGMRYGELARIAVPSLILGQTFDNGGIGNARAHAAINRGDSFRVDVTIANHASFTNFCDGLTVMSSLSVDTSTAFPGGIHYTNNCEAPTTHQIVTTYMQVFLNTYFGRKDDSWMLTSSYASQNQPQVEFLDSEACGACQPSPGDYTYRPHPCQCSVAHQDPPGLFAAPAFDGGAP